MCGSFQKPRLPPGLHRPRRGRRAGRHESSPRGKFAQFAGPRVPGEIEEPRAGRVRSPVRRAGEFCAFLRGFSGKREKDQVSIGGGWWQAPRCARISPDRNRSGGSASPRSRAIPPTPRPRGRLSVLAFRAPFAPRCSSQALAVRVNTLTVQPNMTLDRLQCDVALAYGLRNHGAHNTGTAPTIWNRFPDVQQAVFRVLCATVDDLYP